MPFRSDYFIVQTNFDIIGLVNNMQDKTIILFDGDVDPLWVEGMNSVMDGNRILTLLNGERIRLQPTCGLLFEVGNLE